MGLNYMNIYAIHGFFDTANGENEAIPRSRYVTSLLQNLELNQNEMSPVATETRTGIFIMYHHESVITWTLNAVHARCEGGKNIRTRSPRETYFFVFIQLNYLFFFLRKRSDVAAITNPGIYFRAHTRAQSTGKISFSWRFPFVFYTFKVCNTRQVIDSLRTYKSI